MTIIRLISDWLLSQEENNMSKKYLILLLLFVSCSSSSLSTTNSESSDDFILPVDGEFADLHLTDSFGPRILNDVYDFHRGLDIARDRGDNVYASADGTVIHAGTKESFPRAGNFIILEHTNGQFTGYLHLDSIADGVTAGANVNQGQIIGFAGDSGENINSVHLHFNYYISDVSGEIPDDTDDTLPPLEILDYPDTDGHTVSISNINDASTSDVAITVSVSVPITEMDLNEVNVSITDAIGTELYARTVNYADRTNCGTDDDEVNNVQITPEDFVYPEESYDIDFTFEAIDLSANIGETTTITATAIDIKGNQKVAIEELLL